MTRSRISHVVVILTVLFFVAGSSALFAGKATPKKMNGTWSSIVIVPPNDVLGNDEDLPLPELDTFSTSGTVITSAGANVLPLNLDEEEDFYLASVGIGQGNWKMTAGQRFVMTQWRFLTDLNSGEPFGYIKILAEWRLMSRNHAVGDYEVQILQLDMMTPYYSNGSPARVRGPFHMRRLPIQPLP